MDKEKEVEEMARKMCVHLEPSMQEKPCSECKTYDKNCYTINKARTLYNVGYRKADEVRKETAKEILEGIREGFKELEQRGFNIAIVHFAIVEETCKKYGVEVEP